MTRQEMTALKTSDQPAEISVAADHRWSRIVARDRSADNQFWYSVITTGVYCRPSCPSRTANPKNVQLHDTLEAAKATGFRACKRCNPDGLSADEEKVAIVTRACRLIEKCEEEPSLTDLARAVPVTFIAFSRPRQESRPRLMRSPIEQRASAKAWRPATA